MHAILRSIIFASWLFFLSTMAWQEAVKEPVRPYMMFRPICIFLSEKLRGVPKLRCKYPESLSIFMNTKELKHLAVPPKMGGPENQMMFLILGFALLFSLVLVATPLAAFQFIGFMLAISQTFGFMLSCMSYYDSSLFTLPLPTYLTVFVSILGIASILVDPIRFIRRYMKDYRKLE